MAALTFLFLSFLMGRGAMGSRVPDYMSDPGVDSGWGILYIVLAIGSAYSIASFAEPSLIIPRLVYYFYGKSNKEEEVMKMSSMWKAYSTVGVILSFPVFGLMPLLSFLVWAAGDAYQGGASSSPAPTTPTANSRERLTFQPNRKLVVYGFFLVLLSLGFHDHSIHRLGAYTCILSLGVYQFNIVRAVYHSPALRNV